MLAFVAAARGGRRGSAAGLVPLLGLADAGTAGQRVVELVPTPVSLAAVLVLAHLAGDARCSPGSLGVVARACHGSPRRLLGLTFYAAAATTTVLSLDATVALLTPAVLTTANGLWLRCPPAWSRP